MHFAAGSCDALIRLEKRGLTVLDLGGLVNYKAIDTGAPPVRCA
ncbi:hypothetical protein M2282_001426 [Variovorax boronicumulans]|nr:hypothetical protein [Variovorax boronicumulans]MDH6166285.1 hypothetical protein [Variovorax boronicumulans]